MQWVSKEWMEVITLALTLAIVPLTAWLLQVRDRVNRLEQTVSSQGSTQQKGGERQEAQAHELVGVGERMGRLEGCVSNNERRIETAEKRLDAYENLVGSLREQMARMEAKLDVVISDLRHSSERGR